MPVIFPINESNIKLHVFIIDDSELICDNIKDAIETIGHTATYENDPEMALASFKKNYADKKNKFDVLIVDQIMPKMDGLEFIEEIHQVDKNIPIIMLTIEGKNSELEDAALEMGVIAFIDKENPDRLDNIIHTIIPIFEEKKIRL